MSPLSFHFAFLLTFLSHSYAATRRFSFEVEWALKSPDGFTRPQILVNGEFPGPAMIVDQDDDVEVYVRNRLNSSTSVHFHGIEQLGTPWSDGVPGLTQAPIPAGGDYLYRWRATEYGSYWYHSHYQSQMSDGFAGSIYIRPRPGTPNPFNMITNDTRALAAIAKAERNPQSLLISDWNHVTSLELMQIERDANIDQYCSNSILVNGKGRVNCLSRQQQEEELTPVFKAFLEGPDAIMRGRWLSPSGCLPFTQAVQGNFTLYPERVPARVTGCDATSTPLEEIEVDARDEWVGFNFINGASIQEPIVSIDEHEMWVYAVDGRYIEPQLVNGVHLPEGARYSVMMRVDRQPGEYTMRVNQVGANQLISAFATVKYRRRGYGGGPWQPGRRPGERPDYGYWRRTPSKPYFTYGGAPVSQDVVQMNDSLIVPFPNIPPPREVDATHIVNLERFGAPWRYTLSGDASYPVHPMEYAEDQPLLYYPNSEDARNKSLVITTKNNTWVDIVFVVTGPTAPPHPMHKHSNKAYIIGSGSGSWIWNTVAEAAAAKPEFFNFETPQLRDTFVTPAPSGEDAWLVIRYHVVIPGPFLVHCHIQPHFAGGMAMAFLDGVDAWPNIPEEYALGNNGLVPHSST